MCYVRGKAYMLLKDIDNARECFKEALLIDLKCYDALEALVKYNMMGEHAGRLALNEDLFISNLELQSGSL